METPSRGGRVTRRSTRSSSRRVAQWSMKGKRCDNKENHNNIGTPNQEGTPSTRKRKRKRSGCSKERSKKCRASARKEIACESFGDAGLIGRAMEREKIEQFVTSLLDSGKGGSLYICGSTGTGKTASVTSVLEKMRATHPDVHVVNMNGNTYNSPQMIYGALAQALSQSGDMPTMGVDQAREKIVQIIIDKGKRKRATRMNLVVIDEIDQLMSTHQEVLYQLFEWPKLKNSNIILIGIANAVDMHERFLPRLRSLEMEPELLIFSAYNAPELCEIVKSRFDEQGMLRLFEESAVELCARKIAAKSGDARKALDICNRALQLRKSFGAEKVGIVHISKVMREVFESPYASIIRDLPQQSQYVLCAAVRFRKHAQGKKMTVSTLQGSYKSMAREWKLPAVPSGEFASALLMRLEQCGLISIGAKHPRKDAKERSVHLNVQDEDVKFALENNSAMRQLLSGKTIRLHGANMHKPSS